MPTDEQDESTPVTRLRRACAELEHGLRSGEACGAERWLAAHPDLAADSALAIELVYAEFTTREELDRQLPPAEWAARFPQWWDRLRRLFLIDDLLGQQTDDVDTNGPATRGREVVPEAAAHPDLGGSRGPYKVLERIGTGGMGVVYKAYQLSLRRVVALKVLREGPAAGDQDLARFRTEAEAIARLRHPNIVQVFEAGDQDGQRYLALEYVEGGDLRHKLAEGPFSPERAVALLEPLARAVQHAHEHGIIHRDLKPANVLLTADGVPKVTDFGLAKQVHESLGLTATGTPLGTPSYMAPEQALSKGAEVGPATDVYALGALLYECLTGRPPFLGATPVDTMMQVVQAEPVSPRRLVASVPRDLETICLKCLEKAPRKRYASAAELADDLRRFLDGRPVLARPIPIWERARKWARRRPAVAVLLAVIVLGTAIGFPTILYLWSQAATALQAEKEAKEVQRREIYSKQLALARVHWMLLQFTEARQSLEECAPDLRDREWHYLRRVCWADLPTLEKKMTSGVSDLIYSPDGRRLAAASMAAGLAAWVAESGAELLARQSLAGRGVHRLAFAPDGRSLTGLFGHGALMPGEKPPPTLLKRWDITSGHQLLDHSLPPSPSEWMALSSDGSSLAVVRGKSIEVHDAATGRLTFQLPGKENLRGVLAYSADGRRLAARNKDLEVSIWDVEKGALVCHHRVMANDKPFGAFALRPDGRQAANASRDSESRSLLITLWDVTTGKAVRVFRLPEDADVTCLAFSADGARLAAGGSGSDRTIRIWDLDAGREFLVLRGHTYAITRLAFSPDGLRLVSGDLGGFIKMWDVSPWEPEDE